MKKINVTSVGQVFYAHISKPEVIKKKDGTVIETGKYSIALLLDEENKKSLQQEIMAVWEEFKSAQPSTNEYRLDTPFLVR